MPYVPQNPEDEDQKKQGATVSGTDATGDIGSGAAGNGLSPQQSGVSGWTDVKAYLDANKDQTLGMAQNLGSKLSGEADKLEGDIGQGEKDFEKNVDTNRVDYDQNTVDSAVNDPAGFAKDDANVQKFAKIRDANYNGPNSLSDTDTYGKLASEVDQGVQRAGSIDTEGGRKQLLFETGNNPTQGQTTLDSTLLEGSPEARDILKSGASKFGTLQNFLDQQNAAASDYAGKAKAATNDAGTKAKAAITGATDQFKTGLDARVDASRQKAATLSQTATQKLFKGDPLTDEEAASIGISPQFLGDFRTDTSALKSDYSKQFDPYPFYKEDATPETAIDRGNVASSDDYAKAAALAKLSGQDLSPFLDPASIARAGTADKAQLSHFDISGAADSSNKMLGQLDSNYIEANPQPSTDPAKKSLQLDLIARRPQLLTNSNWKLWYDQNKTGSMGIDPTLPSSGDTGGAVTAGGGSFIDPTTGRRIS